jgi:hypothetical protein
VAQTYHIAAEGRILHELALEEAALEEAFAALRLAQNDVEMAARKYAAVRSLAAGVLGYSPYHEDAVWTPDAAAIVPAERRGRYRFLQMRPREAILSALGEQEAELTLQQIDERLQTGGLDLGTRAINAALMRLAGVERTPQDAYRLRAPRANGRTA